MDRFMLHSGEPANVWAATKSYCAGNQTDEAPHEFQREVSSICRYTMYFSGRLYCVEVHLTKLPVTELFNIRCRYTVLPWMYQSSTTHASDWLWFQLLKKLWARLSKGIMIAVASWNRGCRARFSTWGYVIGCHELSWCSYNLCEFFAPIGH